MPSSEAKGNIIGRLFKFILLKLTGLIIEILKKMSIEVTKLIIRYSQTTLLKLVPTSIASRTWEC